MKKYGQENYTAERMVLAASGIEHEELLAIAEPLLYDLQCGPSRKVPKSVYIGGDFRHRADSQVNCKGPGISLFSYFLRPATNVVNLFFFFFLPSKSVCL